ncbi:MAG TPA: exonuclease domain-containing protein [Chloroflexota bacterium]|nr:exonuclease domain-containing protein [Chloroflexota bacterium]
MSQVSTRYRHLTELALDYLEGAAQPQTPQALAARLLGEAAARQAALVRLVDDLLGADDRFRREASGTWGLSAWAAGDPSLCQTEFAVLDLETTGGRREKHRIVEIAVVRLQGGAITGHFESLVNPQRPIPDFVTRLTGISQEMLERAPPAEEVLPLVREFVGQRVLVGHNIGSDLTFLNYESLWHGLPPFGNHALDTEELAVRLLPELRRPSLTRVAATLGLAQPLRHRALADARLTAAVLVALLQRLPEVAGAELTTLSQLQDWLASRLVARQARVRRIRPGLPSGLLRSLPELPGVYIFRDAEGQALYVGKASSLRNRVAQHFSGTARALQRRDGLLERTATVEHEVVGCELDALLLESERIRTLQPPYNVQARNRQGCPFLRFEAGPFPRVGPARVIEEQAGEGVWYAGPYRTAQAVRHTVNTIRRVFQLRSCRRVLPATRASMRLPCLRLGQALCPAPCADLVTPDQYAVLVTYARHLATYGKAATLEALDARLAALEGSGQATGWEYETLRECRARLVRVRREHRPIEGGLAAHALLMVYRAAGSGAMLFFVRDGRLVRLARLPAEDAVPAQDDGATPLAIIEDGLQALRAGPAETPLDADQSNILMRWIYRHSGQPQLIPLPPTITAPELAAVVERALALSRPLEPPYALSPEPTGEEESPTTER